jgi:hypothetical protein
VQAVQVREHLKGDAAQFSKELRPLLASFFASDPVVSLALNHRLISVIPPG